jgi:hypothetical protein
MKIVRHLLLLKMSVHKLAGLVFRQSEPFIERKLRRGG